MRSPSWFHSTRSARTGGWCRWLLVVVPLPLVAQLTNPLPERIPAGEIAVEIENWLQLPATASSPRARLSLMRPAYDGSGRIFLNDLRGPMYVITGGAATEFLDIASMYPNFIDSPGLGTGFHSFAFHPGFATNGRFYTAHTELPNSGPADFAPPVPATIRLQGVIVEWTATDPSANAFAGTRREILRVDLPGTKHGFQDIAFNPNAVPGDEDYGLLYLCLGDAAAVEEGHPEWAHRLDSVLGTILRIDPLGTNSANGKYGVPATNPFVGEAGVPGEIWAWGFRNPHRISWDSGGAGEMFIGDIGERNLEEVNLGRPGADYGYSAREGTYELRPESDPDVVFPLPADDAQFGYTYPVAQFDHRDGRAIAPGHVYRGTQVPELTGKYLFGDIVSGRVFYLDADSVAEGQLAQIHELQLLRNGQPVTLLSQVGGSRADLRFGIDEAGEIYLTTKGDGRVRRLVSPAAEPEPMGRLINVATRGRVGTGDNILIGGFVVEQGTRRVLIRGVGPGLTALGVPGALADPRIELYRSGEDTPIASNGDWDEGEDPSAIAAAASATGAFALAAGSQDAALLLLLAPGGYTVHVRGEGDATGVALVEVYELR